MNILTQIFLLFLKVNLLSTSGPASVGLLYHEVVLGKLVTESQFVQAVGLSSVLPGSDALNMLAFLILPLQLRPIPKVKNWIF